MGKNLHPRGWGTPVMGRKHCACCGHWRPISDFCVKQRDPVTSEPLRLDYMCKPCGRAYRRDRYHQNPERFLVEQREWHRLQRRLRGQKQRYPDGHGYKGHKVVEPYIGLSGARSEMVPEAPLRAWLEVVLAREARSDNDLDAVAALLGLDVRQLMSIRRAEYPTKRWGLADRMLTRYERPVDVPGCGTVLRIEDLWPAELGELEVAA